MLCQAFFICYYSCTKMKKGDGFMGKLTDLVRLLAELKNAAEVLVAVIDSLEDMVGSIDNATSK